MVSYNYNQVFFLFYNIFSILKDVRNLFKLNKEIDDTTLKDGRNLFK